jgi:hypothetical protein
MHKKPVVNADEVTYPDVASFAAQRRRVLRLLAAGGAAVAAGSFVGCDAVRDGLGLARPCDTHSVGKIAPADPPDPVAPPDPVDPSGDDDSAGGDTEARPEIPPPGEPPAAEPPAPDGGGSEGEARPTGHTRGRIRTPST